MPAGEIAGELLGGLFRLLGHFFADIVFEVLVKGAGYLICRFFKKEVNPDGVLAIIVGLFFWGVVGYFGFVAYSFISQQIAIDNCLDAGRKFNYVKEVCEDVP